MSARRKLASILTATALTLGLAATATPATAHPISSYCGHGTHTTFGHWEIFRSEYNHKPTATGLTYHYHRTWHTNRWTYQRHPYVQVCGYIKNGRVIHY